ncbi:uncharacterized protein LOC134317302 [Trichomycterus rosablanca]|uniref:uncharacterized protein LOC134317302 n=1 Tax=Trichomycterus rosablanca TaxID=2290929 RepID=UPI002F3569B7
MKRNLLIGQVLLLVMMSFISSTNARLLCYSDLLDIIICEWNRTAAEERFHIAPTTNCSLHAEFNDYKEYPQIRQSDFVPVGNSQIKLQEATLTFLNKTLSYGSPSLPLKVFCGNMTKPVQEDPKYYPMKNVKLYPPSKPLVEKENVTWEIGSPFPEYIKKYLFEVQWRKLVDNWEVKKRLLVQEKRWELPIESLTSGSTYEIRVRSTAFNNQKFWSEWSPITRFTLDSPSASLDPKDLLFGITGMTSIAVFIAAIIIILVFLCIRHYKSSLKGIFVPKHSTYFDKLFSPHQGDLKMCLGPGLLLKPEESISPVKVYKVFDSDIPSRKFDKFATSSDTSSFSNSTYFLSKSSKCLVTDQLEPCSSESPYGPAGGNDKQKQTASVSLYNEEESESDVNSPLEKSSFDEQLQKLRLEVQSPDSGFAGSSIDHESQDESGSEGLPSPPVVDNTLPIGRVLPCPVPQLGGFHHQLIQPKLEWNFWNNQTSPNLPHSIFSSLLIGNSDLVACSGMLEPCSDDYTPVKKVQE